MHRPVRCYDARLRRQATVHAVAVLAQVQLLAFNGYSNVVCEAAAARRCAAAGPGERACLVDAVAAGVGELGVRVVLPACGAWFVEGC